MGIQHIMSCDFPGCDERLLHDNTAGNTVGWVQRSITDTVSKTLADGVHRFSGSEVQWLCPRHAKRGAALPSPETHHEVVEFIDQEQEETKNA